MFSYVLLKSDVEIIEKPFVFLKDFGISRGGRAHVARMVLFDRDCAPGERAGVVEGVQRERGSCPQSPL